MKAKDLIKWIQDNKAEELECFVALKPPLNYSGLMCEIVDLDKDAPGCTLDIDEYNEATLLKISKEKRNKNGHKYISKFLKL